MISPVDRDCTSPDVGLQARANLDKPKTLQVREHEKENYMMEDKRANPNVVYCSKCGMPNPELSKFCHGCGGSLFSIACSSCSQINPHYAGFCGSCGRKLGVKQR